jgi:DNA invertase Pin-like site-specific DNA recombinase
MPAGDPTANVLPWFSTSEPEPLARAFGYARPGPDAELGLLRQSRAIERVCRERGLELEGLLSDEPGSPGAALRRALGRIVAGDASALVVARLDSLAGSAAGVGAMMEWFSRNDARFIAVDRELDTGTPGGRVAADALRAAGELERRMLQERTRRGLDAARQKGARPGRPAVADRPEPGNAALLTRADALEPG